MATVRTKTSTRPQQFTGARARKRTPTPRRRPQPVRSADRERLCSPPGPAGFPPSPGRNELHYVRCGLASSYLRFEPDPQKEPQPATAPKILIQPEPHTPPGPEPGPTGQGRCAGGATGPSGRWGRDRALPSPPTPWGPAPNAHGALDNLAGFSTTPPSVDGRQVAHSAPSTGRRQEMDPCRGPGGDPPHLPPGEEETLHPPPPGGRP